MTPLELSVSDATIGHVTVESSITIVEVSWEVCNVLTEAVAVTKEISVMILSPGD